MKTFIEKEKYFIQKKPNIYNLVIIHRILLFAKNKK